MGDVKTGGGVRTLMRSTRKVYLAKEAAEISGLSYRQVDYWDHEGVVKPSVADALGSGSRRMYSRTDVLALRVMRELTSLGCSLRVLAKVTETVKQAVEDQDKAGRWLVLVAAEEPRACTSNDLAGTVNALGPSALVVDLRRVLRDVDI